MKRIGIKYVAITLILFLVQCTTWEDFFNCVEGNGVDTSEVRVVPAFTGVKNTTFFDVEIIYGDSCSVEVFADQNLMPYINIMVIGENLVVETEYSRCLSPTKPIKVDITMPYIEKVELTGSGEIMLSKYLVDAIEFRNSGSGDIMAWNIECGSLDISNSGSGEINLTDIFCDTNTNATLTGSGDIILAGLADQAFYLLTGSGNIMADDFPVETCVVSNSGSGDIYCHVNQELNIVLTGSGDVNYYGTPSVHQLVTGSGHVFSAY